MPAADILPAGYAFYLFQVAPERQSVNDMAANASVGIAKGLAGFNHAFQGPAPFLPHESSAIFDLGEGQMERAHCHNVILFIQSGT